jgi:hypothetical protein
MKVKFFTLVAAMVWLVPILSAWGRSVELTVAPDSLDQGRYAFSVSSRATNEEVAFQVTIIAKSGVIYPDSNAELEMVKHFNNGTSIEPTKMAEITLKKDDQIWKADFTVLRKSLKTPGLCFIFTEFAHATVNGKLVSMPSATFYEMKLQDFVKSQ